MQPANKTTVGAAVAGGAAGVVVTWAIGAFTGVEVPAEVGGSFSTLGSFAFGLIFPR
jgi:hypothetical protein